MSVYPWNEKNNILTWLSWLYNPFKSTFFAEHLRVTASQRLLFERSLMINLKMLFLIYWFLIYSSILILQQNLKQQ